MTLSRYLRDYLYIPLGGNRGGPAQDGAQPHDHDAPRRALARRRLGVRAVGRAARRRAGRSSTPCAAAARDCPPVVAWAGYLHVRLPGVDPVPRAGPRHRVGVHAAPRHARAVDAAEPRRRRRCARRARAAAAARTPLDACANACSALNPVALGAGLAIVVALVGRVRARQRACHPSSTSSSEARCRRRAADPSATASIPAPPTGRHVTARDAIVCIGLCTLLLLLFEGHSLRRSGEEMRPGWERIAGARCRASRRRS